MNTILKAAPMRISAVPHSPEGTVEKPSKRRLAAVVLILLTVAGCAGGPGAGGAPTYRDHRLDRCCTA